MGYLTDGERFKKMQREVATQRRNESVRDWPTYNRDRALYGNAYATAKHGIGHTSVDVHAGGVIWVDD